MKKAIAVAGVAAAVTLAACDDPVSVEPIAFEGSFRGTQSITPLTPPVSSVQATATGTATHLGEFTIELPHTVNSATRTAQGTCTLVLAGGDRITADFTGEAQVGATISIVEQATVTGGTGRFEGASGSFTIRRQFDPAAGATWGTFEGTISFPRGG